jgi:Mrp family chromosome partitioning ATPase
MSWMLNALRSVVAPRQSPEAAVAIARVEPNPANELIAARREIEAELTLAPIEEDAPPKYRALEPLAPNEALYDEDVTVIEESELEPSAPEAAEALISIPTPLEVLQGLEGLAPRAVASEPAEQPAATAGDDVPDLESLLEAVLQLEDAARLRSIPALEATPPKRAALPLLEVRELAASETSGEGLVMSDPTPLLPPIEFVPLSVCSHPEVLEALTEEACAAAESVAASVVTFDCPNTLSISVAPPGEWQDLPPILSPIEPPASPERIAAAPQIAEAQPPKIDAVSEPRVEAPPPSAAIAATSASIPHPEPEPKPVPLTPAEPAARLSLDYRFREIAERSVHPLSPLEIELARLLADPEQGPPLRRAAHSILLQIPTGASRVILLAGADDEPHTSHVAGALAMILATEEQSHTLLVDAQPEARRLSKGFGREESAGLSEALQGRSEASAVVVPVATDRLSLASYGKGPAETLTGPWETLLMDFRRHRDFVVVDARADVAGHLAKLADGIFLVVRRGQTDGDTAAKIVHDLQNAGGRVLGCILTDSQ